VDLELRHRMVPSLSPLTTSKSERPPEGPLAPRHTGGGRAPWGGVKRAPLCGDNDSP
jgi:hypothetical protein